MEQITTKQLIDGCEEYARIYRIISDYEKYMELYQRYFFTKRVVNGKDPILRQEFYEFNPALVESNKQFLLKWPEKLEKIQARIDKNSYKSKGSRDADSRDKRIGIKKNYELGIYYKLDERFSRTAVKIAEKRGLGEDANYAELLEDYIARLAKRKAEIEKQASIGGIEAIKPRQTKKSALENAQSAGDEQPGGPQ